MKKFIAMALALVLVAGLSIGGTLAYLQSEDSAKNVMTVGSVKIEQNEYQRAMDANGEFIEGTEGTDFNAAYGINRSYKLEEFKQNKPAFPAVYTNAAGTMGWDDFQQLWNGVGAPGSNEIFDDSVKNVIDKFVFVKNTGESECYYRTIIAIELPDGLGENKIHINANANSRFDYNPDESVKAVFTADNMFKKVIAVNGTKYLVYVATHTEPLAKDAVSRPSLLQVYLDPKATNEDVALFGDKWEILTLSQAVQTAGFRNADHALNTAFGEVTDSNLTTWLATVN
jgi:predicted ribosomally synthesized peptide with SipW-like signal peptide